MIDLTPFKEVVRDDKDYQRDMLKNSTDREELAERLVKPKHLTEFAETVLNLHLTRNQVEWHGLMVKHEMLLIEAAVGHGKSTWLYPEVVQWMCRCQWYDDWKRILFITSRADLAKDYTKRIQDALYRPADIDNPVTEMFGPFRDRDRRWHKLEFDVANQPIGMKEPAWRSAGISTMIEGTRFELGIMDDPVEQEQAVSPTDRQNARNYFELTFYPRMNPGGRILCIGSSWHPEDLYATIRATGGFACFKYPCYGDYEWGDLLQPQKMMGKELVGWTRELLEKARDVVGETKFRLRYLMDNEAMVGGVFDEDWIEYIDEVPPGIEMYHGWDFAVTKQEIADAKKSDPDFTAGVCIGFDPRDGKLVLIGLVHQRIDRDHAMYINNFFSKWNPVVVGVEDNAFQKFIRYDVQENYPHVPVEGVKHYAVDKKTRLLNLQTYMQRGWKIYYTEHDDGVGISEDNIKALLGEYRTFPHGDHDDILDAIEIALAKIKKGQSALLEGFEDW